MAVEYRYTWSASSNITFTGESDWIPWGEDEDDTPADVEKELYGGRIECEGLMEVLEACGFEWAVETRERVGAEA